ncbi:MAG: hypothetical protein CSA55_02745 [Ilumatobacter coccineus]|uniref:Proteasome accessory factor C n=1 Tax=Ilumatobacter coccineus TaxID=467094 RepID=A0A2G6KB89_9ACTN|nr:MAG: hypothetical protein CSA55_02745 [Ilumatobacter coccineus]
MTRPGPRNAEDRLRRLLVILPWLMERGQVPVSEAAARFDLTDDQLVSELELVAMCGLPPFVDEMIDVFVDEGMIYVGIPRLFTKPLRLTATEAWSLLSAGRAAMALPGADPTGPLGRGLAKLEAVVGDDDAGEVAIDFGRSDLVDEIAATIAKGDELKIEYWSPSRDEVTIRAIVARLVFADRGRWYVIADDDRSGEQRTFRIDRIRSIEPTGRSVEPSDELPALETWFDDSSVRRATLVLASDARWVIERYPTDSVGEPDADGWVEVVLPVFTDAWLARLVVRLGPSVKVIEPDDLIGVGRDAAAAILERYRS